MTQKIIYCNQYDKNDIYLWRDTAGIYNLRFFMGMLPVINKVKNAKINQIQNFKLLEDLNKYLLYLKSLEFRVENAVECLNNGGIYTAEE